MSATTESHYTWCNRPHPANEPCDRAMTLDSKRPTAQHRHQFVRKGQYADPALPYESDVCLVANCGALSAATYYNKKPSAKKASHDPR